MQEYATPHAGRNPNWLRTTEIINRPGYLLTVTKRPVQTGEFLIQIDRTIPEHNAPTKVQLFLSKEEIELFIDALR
jgi:hypothetical protein